MVATSVVYWTEYPVPTPAFRFLPPGAQYFLGTDELGRSVLLLTILGTGHSLRQALIIAALSTVAGFLAGAASALTYQRWPDKLLGLAGDALRSFPSVLLALVFTALGIPIVGVLVFLLWVPIWRVSRNAFAHALAEPFVLRARLCGRQTLEILAVEVCPNILPLLLPTILGVLSESLVALVALEFLGFGRDLGSPGLGTLVARAIHVGLAAPWIWIPATIITVVGVASISMAARWMLFSQHRFGQT